MNHNDKWRQDLSQLKHKKQQLEKVYEQKREIEEATRRKREAMQVEFQKVKRNNVLRLANPKKMKRFVRTFGAYLLGRRNRKQLYSKTYKRKQASNNLKKYKYALYNDGFTKKALTDLEQLYEETTNRYLKRAIAWELALWHANKQTTDGAYQALPYVQQARKGEKDSSLLRKIAIIQSECLEKLEKQEEAKQVIHEQLQRKTHPDLYLALTNLEHTIAKKTYWINQTLKMYNRKPITFNSENEDVSYDDLRTEPLTETMNGPKVSVILPAYNSEQGIRIAIESILTQTWENIELLIVDDCSTDDTLKVIQSYAKKDDRINVFSTKQNSGPYVARNIALQHATGEYVTVNDADDWSHAEKIAVQASHLLNNPTIIANTSEQARFTEDLKFYRRGTPGKYIFSNMSSLMFRREQVVEKIGYWDTVRFAADGEFKRRLIHVFGEESFIDLKTGPLSLPRQTASSLTGSSAFGYNGFFMGARKEYVESFSHYHEHAESLAYPAKQTERIFPVPVPMLPNRIKGKRHIDVVFAADFYDLEDEHAQLLIKEIKKNQQLGLTTGLMQLSSYTLQKKKQFHEQIRRYINGIDVQKVVYGEEINCHLLIVRSPAIVYEWQKYIPQIQTITVLVVIDETPKMVYNSKKELTYKFRQSLHQMMNYFNKRGRWYPLNEDIRKELYEHFQKDIQAIRLATENWTNEQEIHEEKYAMRIKDWLIEQNHYDTP